LPTDGTLRWGHVDVHDSETNEISLELRRPQARLDAALWWPETGVERLHNDIDLTIVDPDGVQHKSNSQPSVFERARAEGSRRGTWKIRIQGTSVPGTSQRVYFAIFNRPTRP
jgi:hypothetical protein